MAGLLSLPAELHLFVGEHLDEEDGLHLALTCRALKDAGSIGIRRRATVVGLAGWHAFCRSVAAEPALGRSTETVQIISHDLSFPPEKPAPLLSDAPFLPNCDTVEWQYCGSVDVRQRRVSIHGNSRVSSLFKIVSVCSPNVWYMRLTLPGSIGDFGPRAIVPLVWLEIICVQSVDTIMPLLWACRHLKVLSLVMPGGDDDALDDLASACPRLEFLHVEAPGGLVDFIELPPLRGFAISTPGEREVPDRLLGLSWPTIERLHLDIKCDGLGFDLTDVANAILGGRPEARWRSLKGLTVSFRRAHPFRRRHADQRDSGGGHIERNEVTADAGEDAKDDDDDDDPRCAGLDPLAMLSIENLAVWTDAEGIDFAWRPDGEHISGRQALYLLQSSVEKF